MNMRATLCITFGISLLFLFVDVMIYWMTPLRLFNWICMITTIVSLCYLIMMRFVLFGVWWTLQHVPRASGSRLVKSASIQGRRRNTTGMLESIPEDNTKEIPENTTEIQGNTKEMCRRYCYVTDYISLSILALVPVALHFVYQLL